jgi:hypothetical protein
MKKLIGIREWYEYVEDPINYKNLIRNKTNTYPRKSRNSVCEWLHFSWIPKSSLQLIFVIFGGSLFIWYSTPFDGVMEAHLTLVSIRLPDVGLNPLITDEEEVKPYTVSATFCHISWELQNSNPNKYPMFQDLKGSSFLCPGTTYTTDLYDIVQAAKSYDASNHTFAATQKSPAQVTVASPTAVVFHETRCGSTLIANLLAGFSPSHSRVYSEAQPPIAALTACDNDHDITTSGTTTIRRPYCEPDAHIQLIRDVFYMMGRVSRPQLPQYVFHKLPSVGVRHIDLFRQALPETPWIWNYRNSIEILMSHFKNYQMGKSLSQSVVPNCLRNYQKESQSALVLELVARANATLSDLTREEYCAVYVASLAESAIRAQESTQHLKHKHANIMTKNQQVVDSNNKMAGGSSMEKTATTAAHWFINYNELPHKLWESVLPSLVVGHLGKSQISNMQLIAKYNTISRGPDSPQLFREDGTLKRGRASESIQAAARKFLDPVYDKMESIRQQMDQQNGNKI